MSTVTRRVRRNYGQPALRQFQSRNVSSSRVRAWRSDRKWMFHAQKNGVYDPVTYALIIETLLSIDNDDFWSAAGLTKLLNDREPSLIWDPVSVGRVVADIADQTGQFLPPGEAPIEKSMNSRGRFYAMTHSTAGETLLVAVRNDLRELSRQILAKERAREEFHRFESPLNLCESLQVVLT